MLTRRLLRKRALCEAPQKDLDLLSHEVLEFRFCPELLVVDAETRKLVSVSGREGLDTKCLCESLSR